LWCAIVLEVLIHVSLQTSKAMTTTLVARLFWFVPSEVCELAWRV